jgi:hypothetical protein
LDIWAAVGFRMVLAAVRLGVFQALASGPLSAEALAARLSTDPRATASLLEALESLSYVRREGSGAAPAYANTAMTARWLVGQSGQPSFAAGFEIWGVNLFELMDTLEDTVRTGRPGLNLYEWIEDQPEASRAFQDWMVAIAGFAGETIIKLAPLPATARRLLDIGGGHGRYALAYLQRYPALRATIFDSPRALTAAQASVAAAGLGERVTLQAGNCLADDLGRGYDAALLFNIVHGFAAEQNQALVARAAGALGPGGVLVVAEQLAGRAPTPAANASKALLGLSYLHLLGGQLYPFEAVAGWMQAAGLAGVRRVDSARLPATSLVIGTKP